MPTDHKGPRCSGLELQVIVLRQPPRDWDHGDHHPPWLTRAFREEWIPSSWLSFPTALLAFPICEKFLLLSDSKPFYFMKKYQRN